MIRLLSLRRLGLVLALAGLLALPASSFAQASPPYSIGDISPVPAGAPGLTVFATGTFPSTFSSSTYGMCFYTGYGASGTILYPTFTGPISPLGGGVIRIPVPASTLQDIPSDQFSGGTFSASVYIAPGGSTCTGTGNPSISNTVTVSIQFPQLSGIVPGQAPRKNAATGAQPPPYTVTVTGANIAPTSILQYSWTAGSDTGSGILGPNGTTLLVKVPSTIPAGISSVTARLCNHAPLYDYCDTGSQDIALIPLYDSSGTLGATPGSPTVGQTVTLSAQFTPTNPPDASTGAVSGTVTFNNGVNTLGTGRLVLDSSAGEFALASTITLPSQYSSLGKTVDLNGDGLPDVIYIDSAPTVNVFLSTTPYGNYLPYAQSTPDCGSVDGFDVGDVNKDGIPDVVMHCPSSGSPYLWVMLGNGDGTFGGLGEEFQINDVNGTQVALADVDKDGYLDVVTAGLTSDGCSVSTCSYGFQVYKGDGTGSFTLSLTLNTADTNSPRDSSPAGQMLMTDVDGDGYLDIVTLNNTTQNTNSIDVYGNQAGASFGKLSGGYTVPSGSIPLTNFPDFYYSMVTGDFNGDGLPDFGVYDSASSSAPQLVAALNTSKVSTFTFAATQSVDAPTQVGSLSAGDFNGDGYTDILVTANGGFSVYTSDGLGGFDGASYSGLAVNTGHIITASAADVNGDGDADVMAVASSGGVSAITYDMQTYVTNGSATATFKKAFTAPGDLSLSAVWPGNVNINGNTATNSLTVSPAPTSTSLITSGTPTEYGQTVTFTATVSGGVLGIPTGTVTFEEGTNTLGTVILVAGVAAFNTNALSAGTHNVFAVYSGDSTFATSTSILVPQVVNQAATNISWTPSPATIPYGTALGAGQLDATASSKYVANVPGTFNYTPATGNVPTAGPQVLNVTFTPTDTVDFAGSAGSANITVTQATPTITWNQPAAIVAGTPLSATQLNATATGVGNVSLPGTFDYSPSANTVLGVGAGQALSVTFIPTDTVNYKNATGGTTIDVIALVLSNITPSTGQLGDAAKTITLTGTGFLANSAVQVNGTAVSTTYNSATSLTAVIPASYFTTVQTLQITVFDPTQNATSGASTLSVTAPNPVVVFTGPGTSQPATQPTLTFTLTNPYPVQLTGTLTLTFAGQGGVDDPAIQFAAGGRTMNFTIAANSTTTPVIQLQSGTVAGTITVTMTLSAGGQNVTPAGLQPVTITENATVPSLTSAALTRSGTTLTVTIHGFSNTREVGTATFHFTAANGSSISDPDITLPVTTLFSGWFSDPTSRQYGSTFTYIQIFTLSEDASTIGSVTVTLTNSAGTSSISSAQ